MSKDITAYSLGEIVWAVSAEPIIGAETFGIPAHIVSLRRNGDGHEFLRLPVKSSYATATDLAHAIRCLRLAVNTALRHGPGAARWELLQDLVSFARSGFARHGWATMRQGRHAFSTPFIADRGCYLVVAPDQERPPAQQLEEGFGGPIVFADQTAVFMQKQKDVSVHMGEDVVGGRHRGDGWLFEHLWSPLANLGSLLNPFMHHCRSIRDLTDILYEDAGADCIKELRIHSHGNTHLIRMDADDIIDQHEADRRRQAGEPGAQPSFGPGGTVTAGSDLAKLIDALKKTMCKPSKVIFDACNAASGTLLQDLSRNLGPDITVNGFSGTGNPVGEGDANFRNGSKV